MTEPTNARRAQWALEALNAYGVIIRRSRDPHETLLVDLLTDLRHLCDDLGLNFDHAIDSSAMHHAEETGEALR